MTSHKVDQQVIEDLRRLALFAKVHEADVATIAGFGEPVDAEAGAVLMDQGDVGTECFFVIDGQPEVLSAVSTSLPSARVPSCGRWRGRPQARESARGGGTSIQLLAFDVVAFKKLLDEMPGARNVIMELLEGPRRGEPRPPSR